MIAAFLGAKIVQPLQNPPMLACLRRTQQNKKAALLQNRAHRLIKFRTGHIRRNSSIFLPFSQSDPAGKAVAEQASAQDARHLRVRRKSCDADIVSVHFSPPGGDPLVSG